MKIFGLTGNIASGKTTIAKILRQKKIPIFEADRQVDLLKKQRDIFYSYMANKGFAGNLGFLPSTAELREIILKNPDILIELEKLLHPLVHQQEKQFIATARRYRKKLVFFDIPLLFEVKDYRNFFDAIFLVHVCSFVQRQRALKRKNMTARWFDFISQKQLAVAFKIKQSHVAINTGSSMRHSRERFLQTLKSINNQPKTRLKYPR